MDIQTKVGLTVRLAKFSNNLASELIK